MNKQDVLKLSSMPLQSPTYPTGPYKFFNRQYLIVHYRTDPARIRAMLPEPLMPDGDTVSIQWLDLPDGQGFGAYSAALQAIPVHVQRREVQFPDADVRRQLPPARRRPRDLGLSDEVRHARRSRSRAIR